jgi:hypothetical protein
MLAMWRGAELMISIHKNNYYYNYSHSLSRRANRYHQNQLFDYYSYNNYITHDIMERERENTPLIPTFNTNASFLEVF